MHEATGDTACNKSGMIGAAVCWLLLRRHLQPGSASQHQLCRCCSGLHFGCSGYNRPHQQHCPYRDCHHVVLQQIRPATHDFGPEGRSFAQGWRVSAVCWLHVRKHLQRRSAEQHQLCGRCSGTYCGCSCRDWPDQHHCPHRDRQARTAAHLPQCHPHQPHPHLHRSHGPEHHVSHPFCPVSVHGLADWQEHIA